MPGSARSRSTVSTWADLDLSRRQLLRGGAFALGTLALAPRVRADAHELPAATRRELGKSRFVYISPLHGDGAESRCHGEVWFSFDRGAVLIATAHDAWKASAVRSGRLRARIWVGDFGPISGARERLPDAPVFDARAAMDTDPEAFERLMQDFGRKYSDEWEKWEPRFRKGYAEGTRLVIRYEPMGA